MYCVVKLQQLSQTRKLKDMEASEDNSRSGNSTKVEIKDSSSLHEFREEQGSVKVEVPICTGISLENRSLKGREQTALRSSSMEEQGAGGSSSSSIGYQTENIKSSPSRKPSAFQNFQKHLVRTLKTEISIPKDRSSDPTVHLALRMWKIFIESRYYSKRVLYFLFGVATFRKGSEKSDVYEKFTELSNIYPEVEVKMAQEYLREQVYRQGVELLQKDFLKNRRIEKRKDFQAYFSNFLEELEQGAVSRRVPKSSVKVEEKMEAQEE